MTDELRRDALSCYGNTFAKTPNIDKLADSGQLLQMLTHHHPFVYLLEHLLQQGNMYMKIDVGQTRCPIQVNLGVGIMS